MVQSSTAFIGMDVHKESIKRGSWQSTPGTSSIRVLLFVRRDDAVRDAEALGIASTELPDLLDGAPDGAEALAETLDEQTGVAFAG